ncbi:MAG: hypothetical protein ACPH2N_03720 [Flavobacteriaceae bacterium]
MKKASLFITLIALIFSCQKNKQLNSKIVDYIPEDSELIIQINLFETFKSALVNNSLLKKTNLLSIIEDNLISIDSVNISGPLLLCYGPKSDYTFIAKKNHVLQEKLLKNTKSKDDIWIFNSTKKYTELTKTKSSHSFLKYSSIIKDNSTFTLYYSPKSLSKQKSLLFENIIINIDASPSSIAIDGVYTDSKWMNIYNEISPKKSSLSEISPSSNFNSFVYSNFENFYNNIKEIDSTLKLPESSKMFFNTTKEFGAIKSEFGDAIIVQSIDVSSSNDILLSYRESIKSFRSIPIFKFNNDSIINSNFGEILPSTKANFYSVINDFIIFAEKEIIIENIISEFINNNVLSNDQNYKSVKNLLSDEVSYVESLDPEALALIINATLKTSFSEEDLREYKNSSFQVIKDDNVVHLNGLIKKNTDSNTLKKVQEQFSFKLDAPIVGEIQFINNHRTKQKDILAQDINNQLYLISNKGTLLWKKKLAGPILGEVKQIDLFKNGRLQMAFATKNRVYLVDILGNDVNNFPLKFKDDISKPLSVFDYDKNKDYRFLVVQNSDLLMYNSKGNRVKGFKYDSKSNISSQPKHIRHRNKDYITFLSGDKFEILNRRGKTRIPVEENFKFSNQELFFNNDMFTTIGINGDIIQVDTKGRVSRKTLGFESNTNLLASNKLIIAQWDNHLQIGNKKIDLEYGSFTPPKLFYLNDKIFITITDIQSNKVWFFDSKGEVLTDFPVYGTSSVDLNNVDKDKPLEFICQINSDELVMYQMY